MWRRRWRRGQGWAVPCILRASWRTLGDRDPLGSLNLSSSDSQSENPVAAQWPSSAKPWAKRDSYLCGWHYVVTRTCVGGYVPEFTSLPSASCGSWGDAGKQCAPRPGHTQPFWRPAPRQRQGGCSPPGRSAGNPWGAETLAEDEPLRSGRAGPVWTEAAAPPARPGDAESTPAARARPGARPLAASPALTARAGAPEPFGKRCCDPQELTPVPGGSRRRGSSLGAPHDPGTAAETRRNASSPTAALARPGGARVSRPPLWGLG